MSTTQETKATNIADHVSQPDPTAAPPNLLARQKDVDWLNGRETCGFYERSVDGGDMSWAAFSCFVDHCTIRPPYIGCHYGYYTGCYDFYGTKCPSSRARKGKRQLTWPIEEDFLCCTMSDHHCMTAIMTLGEDEFLTGYECKKGGTWGEVRLHPSTLDESDMADTSTGEDSSTTIEDSTTITPDDFANPTSLPTTTTDPEPRAGGASVNVGAIAGGVIGGVGVLIIVACCVLYFRRRRREENAGRGIKPKPVFAGTDYPQPPYANTYEKPDDQLPRVATEMPPFSTIGSNTVAELPGKQ